MTVKYPQSRFTEADLERRALYDELTNLPNRALIADRLRQLISQTPGGDPQLAVIVVDVDDFKAINDGLGYVGGDAVLRCLADRLRDFARPTDTVGRFVADEFVLIRPVTSVDAATYIARQLVALFREPVPVRDDEVQVTASIGVSFASGDDVAENVLRDAEAAAYRAVEKGRAQIEVFDDALRDRLERRSRDERRLRLALVRREFQLHYQPVVELSTSRIVGAEALLRWTDDQGQEIPPDDFITLAEKLGLIIELGDWVFKEVCEHAPRDAHGAVIPISVNVSAVQLGDPNLSDRFAAMLKDTGADPHAVTLEITETALMRDRKAALESLTRLRALGMKVSVDDFGTGYSSLTYLKQFPIDVVKIDRSFVRGLGSNPDDEMIVAAVINLAHTLGLRVIAEGVENGLQRDVLYQLGCRFGQGYLWGGAVAAAQLSETLARTPVGVDRDLDSRSLRRAEAKPASERHMVTQRDIEESFWRKQLDIGLLVWLIGAFSVFGYLHATAGQPHRAALAVITGGGVLASLVIFWWGGRRVISTRWRTPFFFTWSLGTMLMMTAGAALDGGVRSPLIWLIVLPVLFAGVTYSAGTVAVLAADAVGMYLLLVLGSHGWDASQAITGMGISIAGILMIVGARNRKTQDQQLADLAIHDGLTGCLTHVALKERLSREIGLGRCEHRPVSLVVADVDRLGLVNDVGGHSSGDDVLATVGRVLASGAPPDMVGRIGGDEFAVIVPGVDEAALPDLLGRFHAKLEQRLPDWIGVTLGAASLRELETAGDLLKRADRELYAAKPSHAI